MTDERDNAAPAPQGSDLFRRIDAALDRVRPYLVMDGGQVELISVNEEEGVAFIRFQGACSGCPSSAMTLQMGIEAELKASVPEVKQVVAV